MPVILVANPKGGVGKSTLASNLAGLLAQRGHAVMLGDADRQQSSRHWLAQRPAALPTIQGWDIVEHGDDKKIARPPKGVSHVVIDTPAGLSGARLDALFKRADKLLIPLQPSLFDIQATFDFIQKLRALQQRHERSPALALVGMRAKEGTLSVEQLQQFMRGLDVPVLGMLRDTQNYVQLAARGLSLWDVAPSRVERDLAQWRALEAWVDA